MSEQPVVIDMHRALALLREVVAEFGSDHLYRHADGQPANVDGPVCRYEWDGAPKCIVGHALFRAGVTVDALHAMDEDEGPAIGTVHSDAFELTDEARHLLAEAQAAQDKGLTWGAALAAAEGETRWLVGS